MGARNKAVGELVPPFQSKRRVWKPFVEIARMIRAVDPALPQADQSVETIRKFALQQKLPASERAYFRATVSVLCDLRLQGWNLRIGKGRILLDRPVVHIDGELERERIRQMHGVGRNAQQLKQSVRSFLRGLEKNRLGPNGWSSIFSLMRDGREFGEKLRHARTLPGNEQITYLQSIISPYIQLVEEGKVCEHTGLPLGEIWRYFRHTWANEYQTVPGRNLMLLIRDAASPNHPVVGIAALASPVVHLSLRDSWIGWSPKQFVTELQARPTMDWARWVHDKLAHTIGDIFVSDLIKERVITRRQITSPTEEVIAALEEEADLTRRRHRLHPRKDIHKTPSGDLSDDDWKKRAKTQLFRSKRCTTLAELLRARLRLKHAGFKKATKESLAKVLATSEGRLAVETIRKHVKAIHIGNDVLDISVCGAAAPYSDILGGKLVAMLLTSPEAVEIYGRRYGRADSIIASSMAGRRVSRRARLVALTTTSLYRSEPNQYTRISIPTKEVGGSANSSVVYKRLGLTRGQGSFHFSAVTIDLIELLLSQEGDLRSVNSIFGEGVSPRLRKVRAGLHACGFPVNEVLTHGSPRVVYGIALTTHLRDVLMERRKTPAYILPRQPGRIVTTAIGNYWIRRWLVPRLSHDGIVDRVERHTLIRPVAHGARVNLPRILEDEPLFCEETG